MNDISQNILEKIDQIISSENEIKLLADKNFSDPKKYYTDLLTLAVADRHLKNSRGFRCLIETQNIQCALTILRCLIDNIARFHALKLFEGRERYYVYNFLDPKIKLKNLKDNHNKELHDAYLIKKLNEDYPGIKQAYEEFCGYAHLSFYHHRAHSRTRTIGDTHIEISSSISRYDSNLLDLNKISYVNATDKCLELNEILLKELKNYFTKRNDFLSNTLEAVSS